MNVTIIGTGYVGLVTAACLAELGNNVVCLDVDAAKIDLLNSGGVPIYENGLKEMIDRNRSSRRIAFTTDAPTAIAHGDILFIAVGTPPDADGTADLSFVLSAARTIGRNISSFKVVVDKSTVPVGTSEKVSAEIAREMSARGMPQPGSMFSVVSNPEFLKEGAALDDFMRPDRIIIGHDSDAAGTRALAEMKLLYAPFNRNHERTHYMDVRSAEFTKYAANSMLAVRISFMNELANLAERVGADIDLVRQGIGSDPRIGFSFLYAGTGYGGSCFPKDVQALSRTGRENNVHMRILCAVEEVNNAQKRVLLAKIDNEYGSDLSGKTFAVWGLAFKPETDDMREAPSRVVIAGLLERGARVKLFDPVAMMEAARVLQEDVGVDLFRKIEFCDGPLITLSGCDALVIMTEWKVFRSPDFGQMASSLRDRLVFDGRNLYDPAEVEKKGLRYHGIGRSRGPK